MRTIFLKKYQNSERGFTLLEILLVVAAIAILAGIVIFAINPGKQLAELRNGKRQADVNLVVNALYQYFIDNPGVSQSSILNARDVSVCAEQTDMEMCDSSTCGQMNFAFLAENQKYLVALPVDPSGGITGEEYTGYYVWVNSNNRITACAPQAELGASISVTR
jgi:prepilin-type N-terminal cleavage/methylation domain-containing protein